MVCIMRRRKRQDIFLMKSEYNKRNGGSVNMDKNTYAGYIEENRKIFTDVSDQVWEYAELSVKEHRSAALYVKAVQ